LLLAVKLDGPDNHADLRLPPLALADWWSQLNHPQGPKLGVPPGTGTADIARIETNGVVVEGLNIKAGVEPPPPTPAKAAGKLAPARKNP